MKILLVNIILIVQSYKNISLTYCKTHREILLTLYLMKFIAFLKPPPKACNIWRSDNTLMPMSKSVKLRLVNCLEEWSEDKASWCKIYEIRYPRLIAKEGFSLQRISIFFYHRWIMNITKFISKEKFFFWNSFTFYVQHFVLTYNRFIGKNIFSSRCSILDWRNSPTTRC